ncbi:MAG TPA: universal stress protein, partial [bacterium]|nr:universal stress protein [bacterium]
MRILYATDGSEGAAAAGRLLARLALGPQDAILLLRVDYPEEEEFFGKPAEALPRNPRAQRYLRRLGAFERAREALHGTTARIETQVRVGAPAEQILACAREWSADLVVVGAMGQSAAPRYFVGSVAERVLRHAVCDVLLARPVRHGLERVLVAVDGSAVAVRVVARAALLPLPPQT